MQRVPDFLLESQSLSTGVTSNSSSDVFQTWTKSGSCPEETVPIRRIRKEDLLRAVSLDRFGQKPLELFVNSTYNTNLNFHNLDSSGGFVNLKNRAVHVITYISCIHAYEFFYFYFKNHAYEYCGVIMQECIYD